MFGSDIGSPVDIFIFPAALENYLIIGVTLYAPHKPLACRETFAEFTFLCRDINFPEFIGKVTEEAAIIFTVIFIIEDAEKLSPAEHSKIKYNIV